MLVREPGQTEIIFTLTRTMNVDTEYRFVVPDDVFSKLIDEEESLNIQSELEEAGFKPEISKGAEEVLKKCITRIVISGASKQ